MRGSKSTAFAMNAKKAETERKQAEETAKAAEKAIADNLPNITGTEKQVNWALTIRAKMLAEVDKKIADNKDRMDADKLATAELQAKAIKKVVANKFTEARFWIDNRDSILQQIIKNNNLAEEIKAEIANLQAAETTEVIAEDDGSNDDDYDEDEIVTVDNTDNDDDDDDDDDELVDPPIDTAEVKEKVKMMTISKSKLDAYEKATNAENNRVTVYFNGNRKQFEVYGTYYVKRKVNCARGEKVYKNVQAVGWHKVSQKEVAEILENYGLTVDEFVAIANGEYEEVTAEVIAEDDDDPPIDTSEVQEETEMKKAEVTTASTTTEIKKFEVGKIYFPCVLLEKPRIKITKRTAKTVHYKVERYTGEFDCETRANIQIWDGVEHFYSGYTSASYYANDAAETAIETVETENVVNVEDSSTFKAAKEELIYVNNQIKGVQRDIEYYVEQIKEYIGCIAKCENFISNYGIALYDLQNKAAALENEVANRKIVDAIDDIGGSADALDASVAAMIELNAVNAQVDTAVENVVKFEIQNFAADVNIADSYATIDTAVSGTVIPVIDEDAEIKNQLAEIADLANREKELEQQIAALQEELNAVHREYVKKDWNLTKYAKDLMDAVYQTVKTAFEKRTEWGCIEINGVMMQSWHWDEYNAVRTKFDDSGFALWFYDDTVPREYQYTEFVKYSTIEQFKAAISDLVSAIERGDETFTFPADETADK